ncbi:nuclear transport factor 2 family protein [Kribbella sp. NPDC051770]|uniref:nuclear transport factor 2 family protein n=1 Tax=Kribbella sp. NPDC051770 TaxID=3155413 RepID=UPI003437C2CA
MHAKTSYSTAELTQALTQLFERNDTSAIRPMLREDLTLKLPASLPYGGEFTGIKPFEDLFVGPPGGDAVWESFDIRVDRVIEADGYLVVQLTDTVIPRATGRQKVIHNLWLFEITAGRISQAQLYADTAAATGA